MVVTGVFIIFYDFYYFSQSIFYDILKWNNGYFHGMTIKQWSEILFSKDETKLESALKTSLRKGIVVSLFGCRKTDNALRKRGEYITSSFLS